MRLTSTAFEHNGMIPPKHTCDGQDVNPELIIEEIPGNTKTCALIVEDPDAPNGTFVHWILYDIPPAPRIGENSAPGKQGVNDFGKRRYNGPCPPSGRHRYFFKLYALNREFDTQEEVESLETTEKNSILEKAVLIGLYERG